MASPSFKGYCSGKLVHTIDIERRAETPVDRGGGSGLMWDEDNPVFETEPALVKPVSGREQSRAQQLSMVVSHMVVMRYRSGVTSSMRVKFGARYFNIKYIINLDERNRWLELYCEEGVAL